MLNVTVTGDRELVARLDAMPDRVRAALVPKVSALALKLEAHVKADKLSGQVLNVRTGALRRSIFSRVEQSGAVVRGIVASSGDVKYAAIHEFGFDGPEDVRAHERRVTMVFGRVLKEAITVRVRPFVRQVHMPARSFLRSSLADMAREITDGIVGAVRQGLGK